MSSFQRTRRRLPIAIAVIAAGALVAACSSSSSSGSTGNGGTTTGSTAASPAASGIKKGLTVYFIPKDTQNPYEVLADKGGEAALAELGGKVVVSSGTADTAAAQIPSIQAAIQAHADAIVIAGNDPSALCPSLSPGTVGRDQGRLVRLRHHLPEPPVHQPGGHPADRHLRGRPAGEADQQHR